VRCRAHPADPREAVSGSQGLSGSFDLRSAKAL
jgi:hypothetical protein